MRTTLNLDQDVYEAITSLSQSSGQPLGQVVSRMVREGLKSKPFKKKAKGLPTFDVPSHAPMVPASLVQKIWDEQGLD
jgi:hypothetical protein